MSNVDFAAVDFVVDSSDDCDAFESGILDEETRSKVNPFLFPLAIEFALTGAIFFHHMFKKVGER